MTASDAHLGSNDLRQRVAELERQQVAWARVAHVGARLASEESLPALLQAVLDAAVAVTDAQKGTLQLYDESSQSLRIVSHRGFEQPFLDHFAVVHDGPAAYGEALERHERVIVEDVMESPIFLGTPTMAIMNAANVRAVQSTPMSTRDGRLLGMLATHWAEPCRPSESTLQMLDVLVRGAADLLEHRQREQALGESDERLRRAQELAHVGSWELDIASSRLLWSDEVFRIFGLEPQEFGATYQAFLDAVHPEDRAAGDSAYWSSLREQQDTYEIEHRIVRQRTGEIRVVHAKCEHVRDASGRIVRSVGMVHDITDRKQAERVEEELSLSEEKFATAFRVNTAAMSISRLCDGTFIEVNDRWVETSGFERGEAIGRTGAELKIWKNPDDRARLARDLRDGGVLRNEELSFIRRNGEQWTGLMSAKVCVVDGERVIIASVVDITERMAAEQALQQAERRYRELVRLAPTSIYEIDLRTGRFTSVNEAMIQALGYSREELLAMHPFDVLDEESQALFRERVHEWLAGEKPESVVEYKVKTKDGRVLDALLSNSFTLDEQGQPVGVTVVAHDITGRKRAEEALREANARLIEADRRKNEFLGMLSHELRNPLMPIRNSLYILERAAPGGEQSRRAQAVIDRQVGHLSRLIDDLLDVTRISRGKIQLRWEHLDFNQLVARTVEDHRSTFAERGIALGLHLCAQPVPVRGDEARLAQALGNLVMNACKFAANGARVTVTVGADHERQQAVVSVLDTGMGISPELLPHVFDPFTQAERTLDRTTGGLGLGLALVKGLIELHHGEVSAHSEGPGKGAEFSLRVPLDQDQSPEISRQPDAAETAAPKRVLVIEDNVDGAESLRAVLESLGHTVEVADCGPEALRQLGTFRPDCVLCDIGLPGMSGYEIARAMRARPEAENLFLVAVTGYAQPEDITLAKESGFDLHLSKPPAPDALRRILASARGSGST